jgi:hypothetical protein
MPRVNIVLQGNQTNDFRQDIGGIFILQMVCHLPDPARECENQRDDRRREKPPPGETRSIPRPSAGSSLSFLWHAQDRVDPFTLLLVYPSAAVLYQRQSRDEEAEPWRTRRDAADAK